MSIKLNWGSAAAGAAGALLGVAIINAVIHPKGEERGHGIVIAGDWACVKDGGAGVIICVEKKPPAGTAPVAPTIAEDRGI